jgi:hypothetical protein
MIERITVSPNERPFKEAVFDGCYLSGLTPTIKYSAWKIPYDVRDSKVSEVMFRAVLLLKN